MAHYPEDNPICKWECPGEHVPCPCAKLVAWKKKAKAKKLPTK
jgi:hypothetical protein